MPELPEVETVRRGLAQHLTGARLESALLRRKNLRVALPLDIEAKLKGKRLKHIDRRAKYLLFHFENGQVMLAHLGMSGKMLLSEMPGKSAPPQFGKHDHVVFRFEKDSTHYQLVFNDARRFGLLVLTDASSLSGHPLLANLGPEPLEEQWDATSLFAMLQESKAPVKSVLMDQRRLVGVGNIYACESLFRAAIHPARSACKVTKKDAAKLAQDIKDVLLEAIASGGSTLRDYVRSSGDGGYFQHHFSVYGRAGKACVRCGNPIKVIRQAGRSTFFCGHCQKR